MLFMDLDGTLLNDQKQVSKGNRLALQQALERGHAAVITTGRPLASGKVLAQKLGLDRPGCYLIAYNGAEIYDWGQETVLFSNTLGFPQVRKIFEEANRRGLHVQAYDRQRVLVEPRCDNETVRRYCTGTETEFAVIGDIRRDLTEEPAKVLVMDYEDMSPLLSMQAWAQTELKGEADCVISSSYTLDFMACGMSKGAAVKKLCQLMGVDLKNAVAVGDAANDLSMIEAAGSGVAMCNGTDEVKAAAQYITRRDNNHDGIAEVVERFLGEPAEQEGQ